MEELPSSSAPGFSKSVTFFDFLDRMRNPASLDLVRSIKSFIVSFSFHAADPDNDCKKVQDFFSTMEDAIRDHPLWAGATDEEVDSSMEGLEKYVMTKLFTHTYASLEDRKIDKVVTEKISLLQHFLKPEHLDIPAVLCNEASWLLAEKELQRINAFKAPREKLLCIMNCCKVINNLFLNVSMTENHVLGGADDFLPVLIYVVIKANPPQLHSNLRFIQLYRRQAKLVSEAAYCFTNLSSAKIFILDLNSKSLSMDEMEFEERMEAARQNQRVTEMMSTTLPNGIMTSNFQAGPIPSVMYKEITNEINKGASSHPYMDMEAGDLTVGDVKILLNLYKDVVTKYRLLLDVVKDHQVSSSEAPNANPSPNLSRRNSFLLTKPEETSHGSPSEHK